MQLPLLFLAPSLAAAAVPALFVRACGDNCARGEPDNAVSLLYLGLEADDNNRQLSLRLRTPLVVARRTALRT